MKSCQPIYLLVDLLAFVRLLFAFYYEIVDQNILELSSEGRMSTSRSREVRRTSMKFRMSGRRQKISQDRFSKINLSEIIVI